ncbi:MAG: pyridoxal phosphate-dependent aminotransferase [Rhodospirillaceae bacterium]|jgi:aspartate aminotransferase|nr:pyridoxal phosphate-dependent aminotransferase [Rhodospirillales bacterium]MBT3905103.1 pyridoxal phosphate-dependent aminotransferase [Rhodospirillaceae bacterium]MBT4702395.1 pyridoxal phosphate-dependent aminotransferase [Rhodospirillaceae bacterium]MBT5036333.1 pyridoxal phosphate-dependent aminotransferase [Rhodospirillaceae bacterium]MBT6222201.1 pyridoxal phosphate-dependent aminotransferase [Rhodospirillaceae bacterium]
MQTVAALERLGTETAFDVLAKAQAMSDAGRDIITLGIGQPDFKTPDNIVEAAVKALRDGHHGYTPANGILPLREAVAADIEKYRGIQVDPNNVLIVPGGKVTMYFAITLFGEPGAEIMYPNPGFPIYESVINFTGAKAVPIQLHESSGFSFSAEQVLDDITPNTRLMIINSPANPTGGVVPREEFDKLVKGLEDHPQVVVMSDEIYGRMLYDGREHVSLLEYPSMRDRLIILDGWSKTYAMTGWRLGYSLWPSSLIAAATRLAINCHSCVNAPTQFAGIEALTGSQSPVDDMCLAFDERRKVIVEELNNIPGFSCIEPGGAFYAFPNITETGISSLELQDKLLDEAGVSAISGTSFGALGEGYLRFSYANSRENIILAMERIRECLAK